MKEEQNLISMINQMAQDLTGAYNIGRYGFGFPTDPKILLAVQHLEVSGFHVEQFSSTTVSMKKFHAFLRQCPSRTPWTLQLSGRATGRATCGLAKKPAAGGLVRLSGPKPHAFGPRQVANSRSCSVQARLRTVRRCQGDECDRQVQQVDMLGTPSMTSSKSSPFFANLEPISSGLP